MDINTILHINMNNDISSKPNDIASNYNKADNDYNNADNNHISADNDYKDCDIQNVIVEKLKEIEDKENVTILHAIESGSRAWGFASPDSDYDVRFIYVRNSMDYLILNEPDDYIDWELNEVLDINGWDLKKALKLFHKSNATLFEWANSPVVYYTTPTWQYIYANVQNYFSCKSAMYHYYGTANKNYHEYLLDDNVKYKKYFYVLRPLLACHWIEEKKCPPPVLFDELRCVMDENITPAIDRLLAKKIAMSEADKAPRIDEINHYIENGLSYYKALIENMKDDRTESWDELNRVFIDTIMKMG